MALAYLRIVENEASILIKGMMGSDLSVFLWVGWMCGCVYECNEWMSNISVRLILGLISDV